MGPLDYGALAKMLMMQPQPIGDIIKFRGRPQRGEVPGIPEVGPMGNARGGKGPLPGGYNPMTGEMKFSTPPRTLQQSRKEYRNSLTPEQQFTNFVEEAMAKGLRADFLKSDAGKYWTAHMRQKWLNGDDITLP